VGDFLDSVANADDSGLAGSVKEAMTVGRNNPGTFAADGDGEGSFEITGEKSGSVSSHGEKDCSRVRFVTGGREIARR